MKLHELAPPPGSHRRARRVGRGIAGKGGKTAGRGTKGQGARDNVQPGFEGGQLPLMQRIPKLRGFKNPFRVEYTPVNLDALEALGGDEVTPETLAGRARAQGGHGEGPRPRRAAPAPSRSTPTPVLAPRRRPRSPPPGVASCACPCPSGTAGPRPGATP